jgi:hypothetical protein
MTPPPCPECGSPETAVRESRLLPCGERRRRRHQCLSPECQHRWTSYEGGIERPRRRYAYDRNQPLLTEADVRFILESREGHQALARRFGRTREAIRLVRTGRLYRYLAPDVPRWEPGTAGASCYRCRHWEGVGEAGSCGFGFPDPIEEGPTFARDCSSFERL